MHDFTLLSKCRDLPRPADPERAETGIQRWTEAARQADVPGLAAFADALLQEPGGRQFLDAVFGNSPFLAQCAARDPVGLHEVVTRGPDDVYGKVIEDLQTAHREPGLNEAALARRLRQAKRRASLAVAIADIAGLWPTPQVIAAWSDMAEAAIGCATAFVLAQAAGTGVFALADPEDPERDSGFFVLAVGKLGARELNYSSDVDLILLFDPERVRTDDFDHLHQRLLRLCRSLIGLLENRTADGYVFRTDLRLRPDPGSTPLVMSVLAAEIYYESLGQNWERAAMIRARAIAGDRVAAETFLDRLKPFIWRKNLDFAAIQDIHSIKRQIHAHRGGGTITVGGHNVKLGRGGIREIEFFVQTQQLIWGGREPALRVRGTAEGLNALAAQGHITKKAATELIEDYGFLRRVEHRLQMVEDEQTHRLPQDDAGLTHIALFLGYADRDAFAKDLLFHLRRVEHHYAGLFEDAPALSAAGTVPGNLVFTGSDPDPDTLETLSRLGFTNSQMVDSVVRGWHHGRYTCMRNVRSRELLTELMPALLRALGDAADADTAFLSFDRFLSRLPAGIQLLSMFHANPQLLDLVAEIMGCAPRLADHLSQRASVLEGVLDGDFFDPPPPLEDLTDELSRHLATTEILEDALDVVRRWAHDRQFQVGVQTLRGMISPAEAAPALSNIAEGAIRGILPVVEADFATRHGRFPESGLVVLALGKLGSREMSPASDLDLILIYDTPEDAEVSDGERPLPPSQYFGRLTQRLIAALTTQTAEGPLFEVDMRLRPSGSKGPVASSFESFLRYHKDSAWTWEHLALTRARQVAGPERLGERVNQVLRQTLVRPRDPETLLRDVADMRRRHDAEHHTDFIWDVKRHRGGQIDVEFIAQYLQLRHAAEQPEIVSVNTREALRNLRDAGILEDGIAETLFGAFDLWQAIQFVLRLTIEGRFHKGQEGEVPEALRALLAQVGGATDIDALAEKMQRTARQVLAIYHDIIDGPAEALPPAETG